jgi:hypothetical protein
VEDSAFLVPVQRQVRGVDIQHDLRRRFLIRLNEDAHHQLIHRFFPKRDLLVAVVYARSRFQPVQSTLACQGRKILPAH